jgi:hypothetical protein
VFVPVQEPTSWYGVAGWATVYFAVLHLVAVVVFVVIGLEPVPSLWWSVLLDAALGAVVGAILLEGMLTVYRLPSSRRVVWTALAPALPAAAAGGWVQPVAGGNSPFLTDSDLSFFLAVGIPAAVMAVSLSTAAWLLSRTRRRPGG